MGLATAPYANRGPIEISSVSAALTYPTAIRWIQVITAGSGGLVVKDEGSISRTYTGLLAGEVLFGPFAEITSMTLSKIRVGDGPAPEVSPPLALAALYTDAQSTQGIIALPASSFYLLTGAPLAIFANGASTVPGSSFDGSKSFGIRWNNDAAPAAIASGFLIPPDMDITANATLHIRAAKTGATNNAGNTPTFAVGLFNQVVGALYDADTDYGGTSSAMLPAATAKTIQDVTLTLALADLAAYPASVTITIKPTAATLDTDDLIFVDAYVVYTKKLLAS
jgi:hypothetical protein